MMQHTVLVVEDDENLREAICDTLDRAGHRVLAASDGQSALTSIEQNEIALVVSDVQMQPMDGYALLERIRAIRPLLPILLITAFATIDGAMKAVRAGALDYLPKPFSSDALIERVTNALQAQSAATDDIIACAPRTKELIKLAQRISDSDVTVLISGESGTGKEVFARLIHQHSPRKHGPFVAINCAAIPENLLEATLFGHEKGAFTGAHRSCPGKFEQAQNGTLLLDEVSEMELGLQAKLLRVLQEREVERIGSQQSLALDVRVLATSNRDLRAHVEAGKFRQDLFYRLNVFPLHIPPLRERQADIAALARHLLARHSHSAGRPTPMLSDAAAARLEQHSWPGNIRELDNLMQRIMVLSRGTVIEANDLCFELADANIAEESQLLGDDLKSREKDLILETLASVDGNRQAAAGRLGISPRTLRYKLARMRDEGVVIPDTRNPQYC